MTDGAAARPGFLKKAGMVLFTLIVIPLLIYGLWQSVLGLTHPFAYYFGRTTQGQVVSTSTWRMSLWVRVRYQDEAAVLHTASVDVLDWSDAELAPGAIVTVHYFPWLTSSPCLNGHWFTGLYNLLFWIFLAVVALLIPVGLVTKLTAKRTAV